MADNSDFFYKVGTPFFFTYKATMICKREKLSFYDKFVG